MMRKRKRASPKRVKSTLPVREASLSKLARLKKRSSYLGDPESIVHMDWLNEWSELKQ